MSEPVTQPRPQRPAARRGSTATNVADRASVLGDIVTLVWQRKLWWLVPLLVTLLLLAALILLEATPVGPLLYPVF